MTTDGLVEPVPPMPMQIDPSLFYSLTLLSKSRSCALERDKKEKEKRKRKRKGGVGGSPPLSSSFRIARRRYDKRGCRDRQHSRRNLEWGRVGVERGLYRRKLNSTVPSTPHGAQRLKGRHALLVVAVTAPHYPLVAGERPATVPLW